MIRGEGEGKGKRKWKGKKKEKEEGKEKRRDLNDRIQPTDTDLTVPSCCLVLFPVSCFFVLFPVSCILFPCTIRLLRSTYMTS